MRIFLDTNVFLEYLCGRPRAQEVFKLLDAIEDGGHEAFLSTSCYCTISYYVGLSLKEQGIHKPEKTIKTREILNTVLDIATIADLNHSRVYVATNDEAFSDFEDSTQYQCALNAKCDLLVTLNIKDFKNAGLNLLKVVTPLEAIAFL